MEKITWVVLGFAALQCLVALINLLFRQRLPKTDGVGHHPVSVLIPARNESENLREHIPRLLEQMTPDDELLVYDDASDDDTASVVKGYAAQDHRLRLVETRPLPEGWLGKNWGCHNLALEAKGQYLLFLDADVRVSRHVIPRSIAYMNKYRLSLLSHFPKQIMGSPGEWLTVPLMHYILLTLLPLTLVKRLGFSSVSAANGQFMLFLATTYHRMTPHRMARRSRAEDIRIARLMKKGREKVACLAGTHDVYCRMYSGWSEAINGFSKNVTSFFGGSYVLACLFWVVTTPAMVWMALFAEHSLLATYIMLLLLTRVAVSWVARQHVPVNVLLLIPQQLTLGWLILVAMKKELKKEHQWKGRSI